MLNLIRDELNKQKNHSITENGAIGYKSTGSALVDINYRLSSLRQSSEEEIIGLFDKAFFENREYALKWLFFARDAREGVGERRLFRICYKRLAELDIDAFNNNLVNIQEYGRWDDLVSLIGISDGTDKNIISVIQNQLNQDLDNYNNQKPISLLAKWLPSENTSSTSTKIQAKRVIKLLDMTPRKYRLMLSQLRAYSNVVEVKMCDNKWGEIDYEKVPSLANLKYKNAFMKHDESRRREYLNSVEKGTSKINMNVATPVDIVAGYSTYFRLKDYDETLEIAWKNLKDIMVEDTLVVADGSGSMTVPVSGKTTALDVANALAIYTSEHNSDPYKNRYITFSSKPQFVEFAQSDSLKTKLETALKHDEVANTNIEAVFDLILGVALENDIAPEDMVKNILIISDMEFDMAQRGSYFGTSIPLTKSLFETISSKYEDAGYILPKMIFWNVNSRTHTVPLTQNELGVILVSGFSQNVLKMMMTSKLDPYEVLVDTITSPRYDRINV